MDFTQNNSRIQSHKTNSQFHLKSHKISDIDFSTTTKITMSSKEKITRVRFNDFSRPANPSSISSSSSRKETSPNSTYPSFPASSSGVSTPLTTSPQIPTFDNIVEKVFIKFLIISLTSNDAVLKEVRNCILTNNESKLKKLNPYRHSYWRDLNVLSCCACIDYKITFPIVHREALIDNVHASHPSTSETICLVTHSWWPNMNHKLIVKSTECKPCSAISKILKSVIPAKQFQLHIPCAGPNQEIQIDFGRPFFVKGGMKYNS